MQIGEVSERVGLSPKAIRYYEAAGVVSAPERLPNGYRRYDETGEASLRVVAAARALGFSLDDISDLTELAASGRRPCARLADLARQHRTTIRDRITQLQQLEARLDEIIDQATIAAASPSSGAATCPVLEGGGRDDGHKGTVQH